MSTVVPFRLTQEANRERLRRWLQRSLEHPVVEPVDPSLEQAEPVFYLDIPPLGLSRPPRCACYGVADV